MRDSIRTVLIWGVGAVVLAVAILALLYRNLHSSDGAVREAQSSSAPNDPEPLLPRRQAPGENAKVSVYARPVSSSAPLTNGAQVVVGAVPTNAAPPARHELVESAGLPGEYVLSFYSEAERDRFAKLAIERGAEVLDRMALGNSLRIRVRERALLDELLGAGPTPVAQSPNFRIGRPIDPPPAEIVSEGGVAFGGQVGPWLGLPSDRRLWGDGVKVAVLDSGIGQHSSLARVPVEHIDLVGGSGTADDVAGHGTAVASLIAGSGGVAGMAPGVSLLDIRVMASDGSGDSFTLARGIVEAADRGAAVINASLGSSGDCFLVRQAVAYAVQKGAVVVASVGNEGADAVLYPAAYESVVAVAAVDARERTPGFSNRGPSVDLAAPGLGVTAAGPDGTTRLFSGTSAAAPLVSGAIAGVLSQERGLTPGEVAALLKRYADETGMPGEDTGSGAGIIDPMRVIMRNQPGIRDVAVSVPALFSRSGGMEGLTVVACAQNRGTETLPRVELSISVDGVTERRTFSDVAPGATVSHGVILDSDRFRQRGEATVIAAATTPGVVDMVPGNNARTAVVRMKPEAK